MGDSDSAVESGAPPVVKDTEQKTGEEGSQQEPEKMEEDSETSGLSNEPGQTEVDGSHGQSSVTGTLCGSNTQDSQSGTSAEGEGQKGQTTPKTGKATLITLTVDKTGRFHCSECDVSAQGQVFEEHIMCHLVPKPYQCLYCSQCFISRREVSSHVLKDHTGHKMNCALKALKRVKEMMKAAQETGKYEFHASVPGKVPLVKKSSKTADKLKDSKAGGKSLLCTKQISEESKQSTDKTLACDTTISGSKSSSSELLSEELALENLSSDSQGEDGSTVDVASENSQGNEGGHQNMSSGSQSQNSDDCHPETDSHLHKTDDSLSSSHSSFRSDDDKLKSSEGAEIPDDEKNHMTEGEMNCANGCPSEENMVVSDGLDTEDPELSSKHLQNEQNDKPEDNSELCTVNQKPGSPSSETNAAQGTTSDVEMAEPVGKLHEAPDTANEIGSDTAVTSRPATEHTDAETLPNSSTEAESVIHNTGSAHSSQNVEETAMVELSTETVEKMICDEVHDTVVDEDVNGATLDSARDPEYSTVGNKEHPQTSESEGAESGPVTNEFSQSNFNQSEENKNGTGLKIVAAFSLQEDESQNHTAESGMNEREENEDVGAQDDVQQSGNEIMDTSSAEVCPQRNSQQPDCENVDPCSAGISDDPTVEEPSAPEEPTPAPKSRTPPPGLGPPSKPVPSSSFLDLPPTSSPITSHGTRPRYIPESSVHFFVCGFSCSFSCLTTLEFRDHLMLDHAGEVAFHCYHCGYQSLSEDGLIRHISAHAHTYSKTVPLYICGASACKFGSNLVTDFVTHQSAWHPDLTVFHCHDCDDSFGSVDDLLKHFEANFLHIINCPHCSAKTTERKTLLHHIATVHPEKPKMVSVAMQIVCRDRKLNNYVTFWKQRCERATAAAELCSSDKMGVNEEDQKFGFEQMGTTGAGKNRCLLSILKEPIQPHEQELRKLTASSSKNDSEPMEEDNDSYEDSFDEEECGSEVQSRVNCETPDEKKEKLDFKCNFCTFVARDPSRLEGHERGHSLPASRKTRFKCMYCPQSFNSDDKFHSHVTCHPGLIRFNLYCCRQCNFDSNQRHIIVKHARSIHDRSCESIEEDLYTVIDKSMESRVLECSHCSYMTRHRKHLVAHMKREHVISRNSDNFGLRYSSPSSRDSSGSVMHVDVDQDILRNDTTIMENHIQRFKCPICQYLLPRAADLHTHVKRHSEVGEINLVMFRCKYCSSASTAKEIVYGHLMEKHAGKEVAIVKKVVTIDTHAEDNGYAVMSVDEEKDCETGTPTSELSDDQMVLVIPDSAGETLPSCIQCPRCEYASSARKSIIAHVSKMHPDIQVMGRRHNSELYLLNTLSEALKGEILILQDNPTFEEPLLCPKCNYTSQYRRSMVQHLGQNHPEVSVMGRNDYPSFEAKDQAAMVDAATGDGLVIIGSGNLDDKIRCLYEDFGNGVRCLICNEFRPKKFFIHLHILRHLNILLWGCQYCSHKGLQKYKMIDHIKKVHPHRTYCVRYLPANVEDKVSQYLQSTSLIQARRDDADTSFSSTPDAGCFQKDSEDSNQSELRFKHQTDHDSLEGCIIGSDELDMKLACLYSVGRKGQNRCVVCAQEFQRKYAIHRHLVQSHLQVNLIGCGYCGMEGVERHIVTDHILETHKSAALSMRNLAQNLQEKVTEFLGRMTVSAEAGDDLRSPDSPQPVPASDSETADGSTSHTPSPPPAPSTSGHKNQLNPNLLLLGKDSLNQHLQCMFRVMPGPIAKFKCRVCNMIFNRKYAIHRHVLLKHLRVGIIGCPYCPFEGVERYQVFAHIKEDHKGAELRMCHLSVDMEAVASEYMQKVNNGTIDPNRWVPPPWSMKKTVKKETAEEEDPQPSTSSGLGQSLVVAMFGGRRSGLKIKKEPGEEEETSETEAALNGEDKADSNDVGAVDEEDNEMDSTPKISSGAKTKFATDVNTTIQVLVFKEKGVKRFTCEACQFTSFHRSNVARHIYRVHEQYRLLYCLLCSYRTLSKVLMKHHMEIEHPGSPYADLLDRGIKRKLSTSSEKREPKFAKTRPPSASASAPDAYVSSQDNSEAPTYTCGDCSFVTHIQSEIVEHVQNNHSPEKDMDDGEEDAQGASMEPEANSDHEETEDTEFASLVNKGSMNQVNLSGASEDCLLQCFYCSYKTAEEEDLKIHFSDFHPMNPFRWKKTPTFRFVCRSCHVKTKAASKMRYHLNRHINYRPYTCTTCGSFYPSPDQCRKHCRANNHSETFTYIKVPRKEARLRDLLKESQEIAMALTRNPEDVDMPDPTFSVPMPSRRGAKKSFPSTGFPSSLGRTKCSASEEFEDLDDKGREGELMACTKCDFSAQTVYEVKTHFLNSHPDQEFLWQDSSTGHVCKDTGEITNAKDVPPDWDMPPDSGYIVTGSGWLSCRHCEFCTSTVQAVKSHVKRHLPKRYLCPYCSMRCSRKDTVTTHVRCAHSGYDLWTIFFQLPEDWSPEVEDAADDSMDLDEPQVTFQTNIHVEEEEQGASSPAASGSGASDSTAERIGCGHCDLKLDCVADTYTHHGERHPDLPFLWVDCSNGYSFNFLGEVVGAKKETTSLFSKKGLTVDSEGRKVPSFRCQLCPFRSAYIQAIKSHMKSHQPHGFMCPYCCMATSSKEKMVSHQSSAHKGHESWVMHLRMYVESPSSSGVVSAAKEKNLHTSKQAAGVASYSCCECDFISENLYQYRQHLASHGNFVRLIQDIPHHDNLLIQCGYCDFTAEDEEEFDTHLTSHLQYENYTYNKYGHGALVDLDPMVKVVPVNDLDLDREGLTLFCPPSTLDIHR